MKFENSQIAGLEVNFDALDDILSKAGFIHAGQWDYERVTFDYKLEDQVRQDIYYFRIQAYATKGETPSPSATVKLLTPVLGKHYYPHGVEYDEEFPKKIVDKCSKKLESISEKLKPVAETNISN
ncbi:YugN family protein [Texcoconibacillus texcoconensis]|uniref:YugN-like family protein n=1 Tax=Texcoconibacillus texcoconensis TaxID=1095777 RepID=A0A840QLH1_9BACI|nr:YugN family protein [Texcoconibacillus texcoconensis]MBB5172207.1 hypothetical protein [Texcoconibacillus texcoconensis]